MISTEEVKKLRDETGVSVMQCKKALEEAGGDIEKAKILLRKSSKIAADKRSEKALGAGTIASYIHSNGSVGVIVELLCETDFVSRNEDFKALARDIAMHIAAMAPDYVKMEDVPEEAKTKAKEIFIEEVKDKPKEMQEKILEGKLNAFLAEKVLLDQPFIKNPDKTIKILVDEAVQKFGEKTEVGRFTRFAI